MTKPYVTVHTTILGEHTPVLVAVHPNGYEQVSDRLEAETDHQEAKRLAVRWAEALGYEYRVPRHG